VPFGRQVSCHVASFLIGFRFKDSTFRPHFGTLALKKATLALKNWPLEAKNACWGGVDADIFRTFVPGIQPNTTHISQ
jgi:hypothetical protein